MSTVASFDISKSAVLALDCQGSIVSIYAKPPETFIDRASGVLRAARNAGVFVIHVQVGFRTGLPEVSGRNKLLSPLKSSSEHQKLFEGTPGQIHPALGPEPGDVVVTKHRVSAFAGTDLHMILRANEIETLVLFGIATSGVVLSTLLDASDRDYRLAVIPRLGAVGVAEVGPLAARCRIRHRQTRRISSTTFASRASGKSVPDKFVSRHERGMSLPRPRRGR